MPFASGGPSGPYGPGPAVAGAASAVRQKPGPNASAPAASAPVPRKLRRLIAAISEYPTTAGGGVCHRGVKPVLRALRARRRPQRSSSSESSPPEPGIASAALLLTSFGAAAISCAPLAAVFAPLAAVLAAPCVTPSAAVLSAPSSLTASCTGPRSAASSAFRCSVASCLARSSVASCAARASVASCAARCSVASWLLSPDSIVPPRRSSRDYPVLYPHGTDPISRRSMAQGQVPRNAQLVAADFACGGGRISAPGAGRAATSGSRTTKQVPGRRPSSSTVPLCDSATALTMASPRPLPPRRAPPYVSP